MNLADDSYGSLLNYFVKAAADHCIPFNCECINLISFINDVTLKTPTDVILFDLIVLFLSCDQVRFLLRRIFVIRFSI